MSTIGWVESVEETADYLLSCFITSNYSQSVLFSGRITSLQYLVKEYAADPLGLESTLRTLLDEKMSGVFGNASNVIVNVEENPDNKRELAIRFRCVITVDHKEYSLGKLVQFIDSKLISISKINNG
jgi:hypothetical protein